MEPKNKSVKVLTKYRSTEEIQEEIDSLLAELEEAKIKERINTYNNKFPNELYAWDMYLDEDEKGEWCSAEKDGVTWDGKVFENEDDAINAAWTLLQELSDENELRGDRSDYTIDTFTIPITELTVDLLEDCDLEHLIPAIIK